MRHERDDTGFASTFLNETPRYSISHGNAETSIFTWNFFLSVTTSLTMVSSSNGRRTQIASSLADGRLFPQAAALAPKPHRPIVLLEGPTPAQMPDVHAHAMSGAMLSLAVMWRLPVIH